MNGDIFDRDGCGCQEVAAELVRPPFNPPGLAALAYRVGGHGAFKAAMLRALRHDPVLRRLGTRADGDPLIALLDSCASMLDVLTFYQERIANEGFLRTATERGSIRALARAIGYELRPGVAAATALAFTLSEPVSVVPPASGVDLPMAAHAVTTPAVVTIPLGTKAQSVPGQNELPYTFETVEAIEARPEWNSIRVPATEPALPSLDDTELYLAGTATGLNPGDPLLLVGQERLNFSGSERWDFRRVAALRVVEVEGSIPAHTVVTLDRPLGQSSPPVGSPPSEHPQVYALRSRAAIFGHNAMPWSTLPVALRVGEWEPGSGSPTGGQTWRPGPYAGRKDSWADASFPPGTTQLDLDRTYPDIVLGSWVVVAKPSYAEVYSVTGVAEASRADFLLQAQVTRLTLDGEQLHFFSPRNAAVFTGSELLPMAERPIPQPVSGHTITLVRQITGLSPGRLVAVRGVRADTGEPASEVRRIATVLDGPHTTLVLSEDLSHAYLPHTVRVNANVAPATHGESRTEVLGSGDSSLPFQRFTLLDRSLTYVSAATASGGRSTLEIRVDGALWSEVDSLYGQLPGARVYATRLADDGTVTVQFGDGVTGARLPTGRDNVVASYRVGTGLAGNLATNRISLLMSRPLGVQEVINPAPAAGGDDPEQRDRARDNAPTTVLTLDRIVSLRDYEHFTRAFSGIGKARASLAWSGERRLVRLVVATAAADPVDPTSQLHRNLRAGIDAARHTDHQVEIVPFVPRPFSVGLKLAVAPDLLAVDVFAAVRAALSAAFSFDQRDFGQPVAASEVLAVVQAVPGVRGAVLSALHFNGGPVARRSVLPAEPAHLLTLPDPDLSLEELLELAQ